MARLPPPGRRTTLILLTSDGDGVWYGPGAPLGLRLTDGYRDRVGIGICAPRYNGAQTCAGHYRARENDQDMT